MRLQSGPPRLRIDNVINHRHGTSADDDFEVEEYQLRKSKPEIMLPLTILGPGPLKQNPEQDTGGDESQDTPQEEGIDGTDPLSDGPRSSNKLRFQEEGLWKHKRSDAP